MDYDKICEHCGQKYDTLAKMQAHTGGRDCLRRQLADANERAGRLEAQMVELRKEWASFRPSLIDGRLIALFGVEGHLAFDPIDRILGGA